MVFILLARNKTIPIGASIAIKDAGELMIFIPNCVLGRKKAIQPVIANPAVM